jgi:hypothetical protein
MQIIQRAAQLRYTITQRILSRSLSRSRGLTRPALDAIVLSSSRLIRHLHLQFLNLSAQACQPPLERLVLAIAKVTDLLGAILAHTTPAPTFTLAAVGLAFCGNAVREIHVAGVHRGTHKVHTRLVRVDAFAVNVWAGACIVVLGLGADCSGLD